MTLTVVTTSGAVDYWRNYTYFPAYLEVFINNFIPVYYLCDTITSIVECFFISCMMHYDTIIKCV